MMDGKNAPTWECVFLHRQQGLFLSVFVDDIKLVGNYYYLEPMWKMLMIKVDLETPTTIHDQVYLSCTQRECKPNNSLVDEFMQYSQNKDRLHHK